MSFDKNAKNVKISKTDEDPDYWLHELQKKLDRVAVQSRQMDQSIFEQINTIMNGKSKYTSVEAAVEDMKERSGLKAYLTKINNHSEETGTQTKTASENNKPKIIQECPMIENTLKNIIESTEGFLVVPAILEKLRSLHSSDVSTGSSFDDEDFIRFVYEMNKNEKAKHLVDTEYQNLGSIDYSDNDIDPGNTDKFIGLMPASKNS